MNAVNNRLAENMRIVVAIGSKDIVDALKNKTTLTGIVIVFLFVVMYKGLPALYPTSQRRLVVYDAGRSRMTEALRNSPAFRLRQVDSLEAFYAFMDDGDEGRLGLVIPTGFDQALDSGEKAQLDGYLLWGSRLAGDELKLEYERQLSELTGQSLQIRLAGLIYPQSDAMGEGRNTAVSLVVNVFLMGLFTVPYLMFEEKQTGTMDTLLISPAGVRQVVMGKALAGLFYCLTAILVLFGLNWAFVINWGLALLAVLGGTLFAVGLGLALGVFLENKQQSGIWMLILGQLFLVPVFLSAIDPILPQGVRAILPWMPMVAQSLLLRYAFSQGASLAQITAALGVLLASDLLVYSLIVWKVRQMVR